MISLFYLLGFLYLFSAAALYAGFKKDRLLARLKRSYGSSATGSSATGSNIPGGSSYGVSGYDFYNAASRSWAKRTDASRMFKIWLLKYNLEIEPAVFFMCASIVFSSVFMACLFLNYGLLIFVIVTAVIALIFFITVDLRRRKLIAMKESQFESFLIDLTGNLYANPNILQGILKTMQSTDYPLKKEFEILVDETRRGVLLNSAFENMIIRNDSKIIRFVISGLVAANEKGVDLIGFLKDQIDYLREKKSLANYIRILSSGPRYSSYVIMLIPVIVLGTVSLLNNDFGQSLITPPGLWVLIYSAASFITGFLIINRIVNITEGER